jgi:hypothetical protein
VVYCRGGFWQPIGRPRPPYVSAIPPNRTSNVSEIGGIMTELLDFQEQWDGLVDKYLSEGYDALTSQERVWFNVQSLLAAVENGGFVSYFFNPGGEYAHDALESLQCIGAIQTKGLLQRMIDLFPGGKTPWDIDARNEIINSWEGDEIDALLDEIDNEFFGQDESAEALLVKYVQENKLAR